MPSKRIHKTALPVGSSYGDYIDRVDYGDAFTIQGVDTELSAQKAYVMLFSDTPQWIKNLMKIRNRLASLVGLKTDVAMTETDDTLILLEGSSMGMFEIYHIGKHEIIAGEKDRHLDFIVSVLRQEDRVTVSTLVKYHNFFGKVYMALISPFHKRIVKHIMRKLT